MYFNEKNVITQKLKFSVPKNITGKWNDVKTCIFIPLILPIKPKWWKINYVYI